jgi:peptidase inhibitor family I36
VRSSFTRKLQIAVVVLAATVGLGVGASPAQAVGTIPSYCNVDTGHEICLWTSANFTGSLKHFQIASGCFSLAYPFDDNVSSVVNGGLSHSYSLWSNTGCTGVRDKWYGPGTKIYDMSLTIVGNNEAGSVSFP